jgi:hypothetical protein
VARIFNTAPKTFRWTVRLIETMGVFLAVNARTAHCLKKDKDVKLYTQVEFYKDLLKEKYPKLSTVSNIALVEKFNYEKQKRCNWTKPTNCKKRTLAPCMNEICEKTACKSHSTIICFKCAELDEFRSKNINLFTIRASKKKYCYQYSRCTNQSFFQCAIVDCSRIVCLLHSYKLCHDCVSSLNCTEKIYSRKVTA